MIMERVKGIEPSSSDWKSEALAIELHPRGTSGEIRTLTPFFRHQPLKLACLPIPPQTYVLISIC